MNKATRIAARINCQANPFHIRAVFFHSSPVLERRRRTHWDSASSFRKCSPRKFNQYTRRLRKQSLFRNVSEYAENLYQSFQSDRDDYDEPPPGRRSSWFRPSFREDGYKRGKSRYRTTGSFRRGFEFVDDDELDVDAEFETIFRSAFGGTRFFYWSFADDGPRYRNSSSYSNNYRSSNDWKYDYDEDYDSSSDYEKPMPDLKSDRLALGLSASGPLNLDDVKNAYRACALKWHPDRHQGSSKVVAEEKFKACSAAYQSLCDMLAIH